MMDPSPANVSGNVMDSRGTSSSSYCAPPLVSARGIESAVPSRPRPYRPPRSSAGGTVPTTAAEPPESPSPSSETCGSTPVSSLSRFQKSSTSDGSLYALTESRNCRNLRRTPPGRSTIGRDTSGVSTAVTAESPAVSSPASTRVASHSRRSMVGLMASRVSEVSCFTLNIAPSETLPVIEQSTHTSTFSMIASTPYSRFTKRTDAQRSGPNRPFTSTTTTPKHSVSGGERGGANFSTPPGEPPLGKYLIGITTSGDVICVGEQHETAPTTVNSVAPGSMLVERKFFSSRMPEHTPVGGSPSVGGATTWPSRTTTPRVPAEGPD